MILPQIEMNDLGFGRWKKTLTKGNKHMMLQNWDFFLNEQIIQRKHDIKETTNHTHEISGNTLNNINVNGHTRQK